MSSSLDARAFLDAVAGYADDPDSSEAPSSADKPVRLGTIDPAYTVGLVRVTFDGEATVSGKGYPWLGPYSPVPGERVALLPVGRGYLILGPSRVASTGTGASSSGDYEFAAGRGPVLRSPDGTRWRLGVSDAGATVWTAL